MNCEKPETSVKVYLSGYVFLADHLLLTVYFFAVLHLRKLGLSLAVETVLVVHAFLV